LKTYYPEKNVPIFLNGFAGFVKLFEKKKKKSYQRSAISFQRENLDYG